jgi:hypothetical protein
MTTIDTAAKMLDAVIGGEGDVRAMALALAQVAQSRGVVLTIETVPLQPLAMGHHAMVVVTRPSRDAQRQAAKNLEDNDAMVGRRRRWSSAGGVR